MEFMLKNAFIRSVAPQNLGHGGKNFDGSFAYIFMVEEFDLKMEPKHWCLRTKLRGAFKF